MTADVATPSMLDVHPGRWRALGLLAFCELLGMSLWFAGSAVAPELALRWSLTQNDAAWLTTVVQAGFVVGTALAAILNLADVVPSKRYFAVCALLGAASNAAVALVPSFGQALGFRFFTGFFLAGVYPPAMKMAATWFRARRGLAIGTVVGALTVGKATPYLIHALPAADATVVIFVASAGAVLSAVLIALFYTDGPYPFAARRFSWSLVGTVVWQREWRLATAGYLGHMFELYSFWAWIPVFLAASATAAAAAGGSQVSAGTLSAVAFGTIAIGGAGCIWGGLAADRRGREWLVTLSMAVSGGCCVLIAFVFGGPLWLVAAVAWVWGFFVIADSAQFSALVTESVPAHAVGTALTVQTSLGFLLTMVSIQLIPPVVEAVGWRWAFPALALGPLLGIAAIRRLVMLRRASSP